MIPHMSWWQRIIAWLLWKMEAKHGFGGGFDDEMKGATWIFEGGREQHLYCVGLLCEYYYIRKYEEWEKNHGSSISMR